MRQSSFLIRQQTFCDVTVQTFRVRDVIVVHDLVVGTLRNRDVAEQAPVRYDVTERRRLR